MTATPVSRVRAIAAAIASPAIRRPNPRWPSNMRNAPSSFTTFAVVLGTTSPSFRCRT